MLDKSIEEMDYYQLLGLRRDASPDDVIAAYRTAVSTYDPQSLASYGLISEEERRITLDRIERAFRTLMDPDKRKLYNEQSPPGRPSSLSRASFRRSDNKMEIQDADQKTGFLEKIQRLLRLKKSR